MRRVRSRITTSAIATAIALLIGLTSASADDLADLKANQDLLKQRIDQLALGAPNPVAPGSASMAGSFPRSFLIPGTNTSLQIGGQINLTAIYALTGGNPNGAVSAGIQILGGPGLSGAPLNGSGVGKSRSNGVFNFSVYDSRVFFETRTPTAWGEAQTRVEFDFLGCSLGGPICNNTVAGQDGLGVRLRLAYGTLGGFVFGQAYNPTTDLAASAEALDTGCCVGDFGTGRQPQVGYTWPIAPGTSLFVSLLPPEASAVTPNSGSLGASSTLTNNTQGAFIGGGSIPAATLLGSNTAGTIGGTGSNQPLSVNPLKTEMPDLGAKLLWEQPWGHLALRAIVHDTAMVDGAYINQHYIGYGGAVSGDVKPNWFGVSPKDDLGFTAFAGDGAGRYAGGGGSGNYFPYLATNYGAALPAGITVGNPCGYGHAGGTVSAACASTIRAATVTEWGGNVWYQHWWTRTLRTTLQFSVVHEDVPLGLVGGPKVDGAFSSINKELVDAHVNLLWSPVAFINTGFEYFYGHRQTIYNAKGDQNVILYSFISKF